MERRHLDVFAAMNTGHDGSLSTGHANSCKDMLSRLETMVLMGMELPLPAIRSQIASGIDILIHLGRMRDKEPKGTFTLQKLQDTRNPNNIILNDIYRFEEEKAGRKYRYMKIQYIEQWKKSVI